MIKRKKILFFFSSPLSSSPGLDAVLEPFSECADVYRSEEKAHIRMDLRSFGRIHLTELVGLNWNFCQDALTLGEKQMSYPGWALQSPSWRHFKPRVENASLSCQEMVALCFRLRTWSPPTFSSQDIPWGGERAFYWKWGGGGGSREAPGLT